MRFTSMIAVLLLVACGSDEGPGTGPAGGFDIGDASAGRECVDEDGDGFGDYCDPGRDCDDDDPDVTDLCFRCSRAATPGCPCEPGSKPMWCDPPDQAVTMNGQSGILVCKEGTLYCRDGLYSACEILLEYATFIPD